MSMNAITVKQKAHELIDELPDDATWDELAYRMAVRASIERRLSDAEAGRVSVRNFRGLSGDTDASR